MMAFKTEFDMIRFFVLGYKLHNTSLIQTVDMKQPVSLAQQKDWNQWDRFALPSDYLCSQVQGRVKGIWGPSQEGTYDTTPYDLQTVLFIAFCAHA